MKDIKVNFYLDADKENQAGQCPIMVRSRHNSAKLIRRATGELCKASGWDTRKKLPKDPHQKNVVTALEKSIVDQYKTLAERNPAATLADVWSELKGEGSTAPRSTRIVDWVDHYLQNAPYAKSYTRGVMLLKVHLKGQHNLTFDKLTQTRVDSLCKAMADAGKSSNTILKTLKFVKQVAKMARDEGVKVATLDFKAPKNYHREARTEIRLTFDEIKKIQALTFDDKNEERARDLFVLQCFTGLRHVDIVQITPEHIHKNFIGVRQQKTGRYVYVTTHKYSTPIINKYLAKAKSNAALFDHFKQQYYNRTIKTIARRAKLKDKVKQTVYNGPYQETTEVKKWRLVKSHTGRRTFARLLSQFGLDEQTIALEMGHSAASITQHYIGSRDHLERIQEVQKAWSRAEKQEVETLMSVA
jgi:integrase